MSISVTAPFNAVMHAIGRIIRALTAALVSVFGSGFTHAGNLAYLSLLTLLPFFILVAAAAGAIGRTGMGGNFVGNVLAALPPDVATLLEGPAREVIEKPASGGLLTLGVVLVLWTVSSYAETIRDIIRSAHGLAPSRSMLRYRLLSMGFVLAGVALMLFSLAAQLMLTAAEAFMLEYMPAGPELVSRIGLNRLLPPGVLFIGVALAFFGLTPGVVRRLPWLWPGALATSLLWISVTMVMPSLLARFSSTSVTYGSLGGVIITLLYFWVLGLCLVFGVHFNAALAKAGQSRLKAQQETRI